MDSHTDRCRPGSPYLLTEKYLPTSRPSTQDRNFPQKTEGNIQRSLYIDKADHAIRLTQTGVQQAELAGAFLAERLGHG